MTTALFTLLSVVLMFWFGFGPILLLLPGQEDGRRVLLLPFAGLSGHILVSVVLAQFELTGHAISVISLVLFSGLAFWGLSRSPLTRQELRDSAVPLAIGLATLVFIAWPLFHSGFGHYWGYANPDQPWLGRVLDWIHLHPYGPVGGASAGDTFRGVPENTLLAMFYFISTVATLTGTGPSLLFNVVQASLIPLVPIGVFLFAGGLGLPRRTALLVSVTLACSSLVAYTFYLDSLGALSVIGFVPASLALLLEFGETGSFRYAALLSGICAAMYYNYMGATGVLIVFLGALGLHLLLSRKLSIRRLLGLVALTAGLIAFAWTPLAVDNLRLFLLESVSNRLVAAKAPIPDSEILNGFALAFTEQGIPFFWGLKLHAAQFAPWHLVAGFLCFILLALSISPRVSQLPRAFVWILAAAILPVVAYTFKGNGYGVYKLAAWISPFLITGLIATLLGFARLLREHQLRKLAVVPYLAIAAYIGINGVLTVRLAAFTQSAPLAGTHQSLVDIPPEDVRQLRELNATTYDHNILVMLGSGVTQLWASEDLPFPKGRPFRALGILTQESVPTTETKAVPEQYVLHLNNRKLDVVDPPEGPHVWSNGSFALSRLDQIQNALFTGLGWYRIETSATAAPYWRKRYRWLRKRAEFLLFNPRPGPQRLLITMIGGYGSQDPVRHVAFLLNGRQFDEVEFSGYTRILTKPFSAAPPWAQIELAVREDVTPLPRTRSLWASWVPAESRRLNVAVSEAVVVDGASAGPCVSRFDVKKELEGQPTALVENLWPDGWIGAEAAFHLLYPPDGRQMEITGMLPQAPGMSVPYPIFVEINERPVGEVTITNFGEFRAVIPLPDGPGSLANQVVRVRLKPSATFRGENNDTRALSLRPYMVGFTN